MPTPPPFRSPDDSTPKAISYQRAQSSFARPSLIAGLLILGVSLPIFAQQRVIVNPTFMQRFQRDGTPLPDYNCSVHGSFPTASGCVRYLGDALCRTPGRTPSNTPVDTQGCMAGWITTDPFNGFNTFVSDGYIKAPTQPSIGTDVGGLNVANGSAELNAENPGRLYQIVCLAAGETIPFIYSLGNPQGAAASQAKFGVFDNSTVFPGNSAPGSFANSSVVMARVMTSQSGTITAPATAGLYQIGFEAIQPSMGAVGNIIANVNITLKPFVDFPDLPLQILEGQTGFLLVRVNGTVPAGGISVSLHLDAGTASPADYTLGTPTAYGASVTGSAKLSTNGAGGYLLFIPQGAYDANILSDSRSETSTMPSGSVLIPISTTDDSVVEDNERFSLTLEAPGTNGSSPIAQWGLGSAARSCWTAPSPSPSDTATVTIVDNDVDLAATKAVDNAAPASGSNVTYTVTFKNNTAQPTVAPLTAHDANAPVSDALPSGLTFTAWTCTATGNASCPGGTVNGTTSGSGPIGGNAFLPAGAGAAGGMVTYTITAQVGGTQCTSVQNTATVTVPAPLQEGTAADPGFTTPALGGAGNDSASASIAPICPATLAVAVSDGSSTYTPGSTGTYTVTVTNSGLAAATGLTVSDPLPSGVTLTAAPTCAATGTATCGTISGTAGGGSFGATGASLATGAGNSLVYTLPVAFAPTLTADPLVSTASASASNAPTPVTGSDSDARSPFTVGISKSSSATVAQPGGTVSFTVTATNGGAVAAPNTVVADPLPAGIASFTWSCTAAGGAACPNATGSGALAEALATFPAGGSVQYQISAVVSAAPPATVTNTATATPPAGGVCSDASTPPCSSSAALPAGALVAVQKSTATTTVLPNGPVSFTVKVTNSGSVAAPNTLLGDPLPAGLASQTWTCAGSGGAVCPAASGSGALNETIATLPAGGALTYAIAAVAVASPPASVSNTATVTPPAGGTCAGSCSDTAVVSAGPVVSVSKSTAATTVLPGGTIEYTVVVENAGAVAAANTVLSDPLPAGVVSATWTCAATGGAVCPAASGSGGIAATIATLPTGGRVTYTLSAVAASQPPATTTNTATITPPSGGACAGSCSATVTTPAAAVIAVDAPTAIFSAAAGQNVTFSFTVASSGNGPADGARIDDPIPAGLMSFTWICAASGGAVCPHASGTGPISETVATFPAGGSLTYTVTARVATNPPPAITNTVTATPPAGGLCGGSCTLTMLIQVAIASIPTLGTFGLLLLAICLGGAALLFLRR